MNVEALRLGIPVLQQGNGVVYLDNGATTLKPQVVIDAVRDYYSSHTSNIHRGDFDYAQKNDRLFDETRSLAKAFINAEYEEELIFTFGTTHGLNFLARSLSQDLIEGDEIILTEMEHHANIVIWQILAKEKGLIIKYVPFNDGGDLDLDRYKSFLNKRTKIVSAVYISHVLGTVNPIKKMAKMAHEAGALFITDAAQAAGHRKIDVRDMETDFLVLSAHKAMGPSGVGLLYGRKKFLENMPVIIGGGGAIDEVTLEKTIFAPLPYRFEPGTPAIEGVIGFGKALEWLMEIGMDKIERREKDLFNIVEPLLREISFIKVYGRAIEKAPIFSFDFMGVHSHDVGTILNDEGIAVRTGKHCANPLLKALGAQSLTRASFSFYNLEEEAFKLVEALKKVREVMGV